MYTVYCAKQCTWKHDEMERAKEEEQITDMSGSVMVERHIIHSINDDKSEKCALPAMYEAKQHTLKQNVKWSKVWGKTVWMRKSEKRNAPWSRVRCKNALTARLHYCFRVSDGIGMCVLPVRKLISLAINFFYLWVRGAFSVVCSRCSCCNI